MKKAIYWIIPTLISLAFFLYVVFPSSYFNFLPYAIHESMFQGDGYEREFMIAFDFLFSILIFRGIQKMMK